MGKKLDALLGRRHLNKSKFKALVKLAVYRPTVLKSQRRARCSIARSDAVQPLNLGHHDRALLRVEPVIKSRVCPEELKEAVSSLVYAARRCGQFPELQEMRMIFTSRFGKEIVTCAIELRNNCRVHPTNEEESSAATEEKFKTEQKQNHPESTAISGGSNHRNGFRNLLNEIESMEGLLVSLKGTRKYKDVTDAAEEAFKSAAYAAAAARAAVELSRSESHDPADQNCSGSVHPIQRYHSDSEDEIHGDEKDEETKEGRIVAHSRPLEDIVCYASDDETRNESGGEQVSRIHELGFDIKHRLNIMKAWVLGWKQSQRLKMPKQILVKDPGSRVQSLYRLNAGRRPLSVRTRRAQGR
ncbi:hypothetical protein RHSIM_Rhsim12G0082500 [Rhododendron simsii]|uniref:Uncharacterized protein n=1 Tax=Rhododendron simsii TaxID=118357 RepID=A0A834L6Q1_RHOSS|nr:hypothetical protein RHSIM_Rhsim12G0082500 [Rhododendron simsii]